MNFITMLQEMAAVHLDDKIADLIISGDIEKAVVEYIGNIVSKKATLAKSSSATTKKLKEGRPPKSIKISPEKLEQIPPTAWDKFDEVYKQKVVRFRSDDESTRKQSKGTVVKTRGGDDIVITSGQKQKVIKDDLAKKVLALIKEREADLEKEDDKDIQRDIHDHLRALHGMLEGLHATRTGRAVIPGDPKKLEQRYKKIGDEYKKKNMKESLGEASMSPYNLIVDGIDKLISVTENPLEKNRYIKMKKDFMSGLSNVSRNSIKENIKLNIYYGNKMFALMEAEDYRGRYFAENYYFSAFSRAFKKDVDTYGIDLTEELYEDIYGKDILYITDAIKENEVFFESIDSTRSHLLFEGYGMDQDLSEGVWDIIKKFGGASMGKIQKFLGQGVGWAKELMTKGTAFFTELPIVEIAIPAIAITGTIIGGVKLINKIRKKANKAPLSKEEKEKFKEIVRSKEEEVKKYI